MQKTSATWKSITAGRYTTEARLLVAGRPVIEDDIFSVKTSLHLFPGNSPTAGNAVCGHLSAEFLQPSFHIPRMAEVVLQVQVSDGSRVSEWLDQGHYFIDTRRKDNRDGLETLSIDAFDSMLKMEQDCPLFDLDYPTNSAVLASKIASAIGVRIDSRTIPILQKAYPVEYTAGYSMREVMSGIAAMYGGTWAMSPVGELRLIRVDDIPQSSGYLITEGGSAITFGGVKIIV